MVTDKSGKIFDDRRKVGDRRKDQRRKQNIEVTVDKRIEDRRKNQRRKG